MDNLDYQQQDFLAFDLGYMMETEDDSTIQTNELNNLSTESEPKTKNKFSSFHTQSLCDFEAISAMVNFENEKRQRTQKLRDKFLRDSFRKVCLLLKEISNRADADTFMDPVDPVALNIPTYFDIIKEPMDLGTIKTLIDKRLISTIEEVRQLVQRTFINAMTFNPPNHPVNDTAQKLLSIFETKYVTIENDLRKNLSSIPQSESDDDNTDIVPFAVSFHNQGQVNGISKPIPPEYVNPLNNKQNEEVEYAPQHFPFNIQNQNASNILKMQSTPPSPSERKVIFDGISVLRPSELVRVVKIVMGFHPQLRKVQLAHCCLEIDFNALDPCALWALGSYLSKLALSKKSELGSL